MSGNEGLFILTRYLWRCKRLFLSFYCILCWPMRCEESCFCAMLIFLLMNRYEISSIASEISFKHFLLLSSMSFQSKTSPHSGKHHMIQIWIYAPPGWPQSTYICYWHTRGSVFDWPFKPPFASYLQMTKCLIVFQILRWPFWF